ncbi:four helix bundle protein [Endozoicomonas euniceicola]|uniref:Four helix bundle protein n=1 Tax=Endozoicomonas euniceicola TaxID=1234143 RepID=A0ABY6H2R5_9GAMM|nr:four helix bundle protein [Endozoicomonas euniceicola]UYM18541.1 four helix bundle protein [Endozoicomonas euniceicola]
MDFEKLDVWKKSARLSAELYKALKELRDFGFRDQITRSGLSVPSNIAEGMSLSSNKQKQHFLSIAKGSCAELRTQIYIGMDIGYIDKKQGRAWLIETREIAAMLSSLMNRIKADGG